MEKSKPVPIRFSTEELDIIKKFMKKYKMKSMNDLVRKSVAVVIGMIEGIAKLEASGNIDLVEAWQNSMRKELSKNKKQFKKFSQAFQITEKIIIPKIEKDLSEGAKIVKPFAKIRKSGRPKKPKRKRGDRKNRGYEK